MTMHPDMQIIIDANQATTAKLGDRGDSPEAGRLWWRAYTARLGQAPPTDMAIHDHTIPTPNRDVPVRVYRPAGPDGPRPCIIYMHGGGFRLGDLDSSDSNAWGFAAGTGAVVVSVDYRLTPEHPYPAAFNDCYGVLDWIAQHPTELELAAGRIALAGDSAGGCLGAALCLAARDRGGPAIVAQALIYPVTELAEEHPSYTENEHAPGLTTELMRIYRDLYLPDDRDSTDPYARPAQATDYSALPPAWIHSAAIDPIRDDGRTYAAKLARAGNWVTYREARGMIHGFMRARFQSADARAEFDAIIAFLSTHLAS
ncbi:MAG TPA: alpha/beta hydrolase [Dehalococcoidia bacterium]|nr:alpha/beta hydrolase [Dehalococcoidia bacterium]